MKRSIFGALALTLLIGCNDEKAAPEPTKTSGGEAKSSTTPLAQGPTATVTSTAMSTTAAAATDPGTTASAEAIAPTAEASASSPASASAVSSSTFAATTQTASAAASASVASTTTAASSAPAASSSGPDVVGQEKKQAAFSAYLSGKGAYKVGEPASVTAVVSSLGDFHINQEYPYKFVLDAAPAGVSYSETTIRNVSRTDKRATISIPFTPKAAGTATISGVCSLSVCTPSNCLVEKVPLSVTVKIE